MNFGFSMVFFAVWPGGRRCANCRDAHFFERYCDESIFTRKTCKTTMEKTKKKQKVQFHGQGLGRGLAGDMGLNFFFWGCFSIVFCSLAKTSRKQKKQKKTKSSDPWARSGLSTHKPKNQKTKKPRNQKTKNQKTKKPKKTKKPRLHTPRGGGQMQSVGSCLFVFLFFFVFLVFWFVCG